MAHREIPLTRGKVALVSEEDFERVIQFKWFSSFESRRTKHYAKRRCRKSEKERWGVKHIRLHHFILNITSKELPAGHVVDHINNDGLDNRRENLRIIPQHVNIGYVEDVEW